ncbi:MAG: cytidylate kinase-like family protein [Spirochaetaceae bacterium]|nr:cytidylate kinase-like family protein [Spirochaetaceae bacterium]MBP5329155.1 cytidylate kinase-like family protein [Spirochaetaceae bacterium]
MAIIAFSRQVAALGDEISALLAKEMNYKFISRHMIEERLVKLGFPAEKLKKYDEIKPGFLASLAKDRDEYLDYLQTAILEAAAENNCILIGRGAFAVLEDVPNCIAVRLVSSESARISRLMEEFSWDEKKARQRIDASDTNRLGFHKSFFNLMSEDPSHYHLTLNTALMDMNTSVNIISTLVKSLVTPEKEAEGKACIDNLLVAQRLVNKLVFEYRLPVNFLRVVIKDDKLSIHGVSDSAAVAEQAVSIASSLHPDKNVVSCISIVQDFKSYP